MSLKEYGKTLGLVVITVTLVSTVGTFLATNAVFGYRVGENEEDIESIVEELGTTKEKQTALRLEFSTFKATVTERLGSIEDGIIRIEAAIEN